MLGTGNKVTGWLNGKLPFLNHQRIWTKLFPLILSTLFIILLSYFNYKLYSNNFYTIFDLGLGYRLAYLFSTTLQPVGWPIPNALVSAMPFTKMFYVVIGFSLFAYNSPFTVLVDQTIVIGFGAYALFNISYLKTKGYFASIGMQVAYFLYPSTYGYMAQGGNYMVYLEGLMLISYMFYLKDRKLLFLLFASLAAITNAWAVPMLFLLYLIELIHSKNIRLKSLISIIANDVHHELSKMLQLISYIVFSSNESAKDRSLSMRNGTRLEISKKHTLNLKQFFATNYGVIGFFFVGLAIFLFEAHTYTLMGLISSSRVLDTSSGTSRSTLFSLYPFFDSKVSFISGLLQPLLYTPLLSIYVIPAAIYFVIIAFFTNYFPYYFPLEQYPYQVAGIIFISSVDFLGKIRNSSVLNKIVVLILVSSFVSFALYSPFSIDQVMSGHLSSELQNSTLNSEIDHAYSLIPLHSTAFIQNDMPQLMGLDKVYMAGYYDNQTVDFAVMNPIPLNNIAKAFGGFSAYWANKFAHNTSYGIYESVQGVIIYKLDYNLKPVYYVPAHYYLSIESSFQKNQSLPYSQFSGNFLSISPGVFNVSFELSANSLSELPPVLLIRVMYPNNTIISSTSVPRNNFILLNGRSCVNVTIVNSGFYTLNFGLFSSDDEISQGTFVLDSLTVNQIHY